jgi:hypothetical protein
MSNSFGNDGSGRRPERGGAAEGGRSGEAGSREGSRDGAREGLNEGRPLTFEFGGQRVGYFEEIDAYPSAPGKYRYMPYRALGHLKMIEACARDGSARCTYTGASGTIGFIVRTAGEYGLLEISEIAPAIT